MKASELRKDGWTLVAAAAGDVVEDGRFLLRDPSERVRLVDTREGIVYPPQDLSVVMQADSWQDTSLPPLAVLRGDLRVFDSDTDLARYLSGRRTATSLGSGGQPERVVPDLKRSWSREENPLHQDLKAPTFVTLTKHLRETRSRANAPSSVQVVVFVTEEAAPQVQKWLSPEPRSKFWKFSRRTLRRDDRVYLVPAAQNFDTCDALVLSSQSAWLGRRLSPKVSVIDPKTSPFYRAGFADVVCFSGRESKDLLPKDLWATRSNALVVDGRTVTAPQMLTAMKPFDSGAVLLADVLSNRLWQQFTRAPRFDDLMDCLRGLFAALKRRGYGPQAIQVELNNFLRSVAVADFTPHQAHDLEKRLMQDPMLSEVGLELPIK